MKAVTPNITVSIVSHNHADLVKYLVAKLSEFPDYIARVVLTHNIDADDILNASDYPFEIVEIHNKAPLGFGANHNQAFKYCDTDNYCVMNPDIMLDEDPFPVLLDCMSKSSAAIVAPYIVDVENKREDSARYFPTPWGLFKKVFGRYDGVYPVSDNNKPDYPDWVAGMFMLIKSEKYKILSGFDESYFLYYEDVDLCARVWEHGYKVALCPRVSVVHDARRESHRNLLFLQWHFKSAMRFFIKHLGRTMRKRTIRAS